MIRTKLHIASAASLLALGGALVAAPPTPGPTTKGSAVAAASGKPALAAAVSRPRGAAFASVLYPSDGPSAAVSPKPASLAKLAQGYEIVVLAPHRPIRARVTMRYEGKTLDERWLAALKQAFKAFDRDGDGFLNGHESQYIFSDVGLSQLMQNAYYMPTPNGQPTLTILDSDGDRRVAFEEFAAYYKLAAARAAQAFPPADEQPFNAQTTEAIFKLCDTNGDGKLTKDEVLAVEKLLATKDIDEDECLSVNELVPNGGFDPRQRFAPVPVRGGGAPAPPRGPQNVVVFELDRIPGTFLQQRVMKEYDKNADGELSLLESGFDPATYARLDIDGNRKLSPEELEAWRTGPADLDVTLSLAPKAVDCKAEVTTDPKRLSTAGFSVKSVESGRVVVRHGRQPIEFWAYAQVFQNGGRAVQLKQQWAYMFQQLAGTKEYVEEKDFGTGQRAVQFQMLRVLFDPADMNSDGKLTLVEFDRYFDLQQSFVDLALAVAPAVQTPTLFQLLDENRDGRLGVRELRTAWERLLSLEPNGPDGRKPDVISRTAIQPSVSVRLSRMMDRGFVVQQINFPNQNQFVSPLLKGPTWFRKMDRNADGDVSRIEFLGTKAEFDAMDTDRDGLVSVNEAEAYEKKMREPAGK